MLYNDRGIKKWQGFVLAEHGAALAENKRAQQEAVKEKEQQTEQEIGRTLEQAFRGGTTVKIQMNYRENGMYTEEAEGVIRGFDEENVYISNGEAEKTVELSMIRNVESVVRKKWYQ